MSSNPFTFEGIPPDRDVLYKNAQCMLRIVRPARHVIVTRVEGFFTKDALAAFDSTFRRLASDGVHYAVFHDWWEVTDYVPEARGALTALGRDQEHVTDAVHILFRSKLVAFGVKIASIALRNITSYSDRAPFEQAVRDALRADSVAPRK